MFFDGSACDAGCGVGLLIISPWGAQYEFAFRLSERRTNNQTEYEALCKGLELLLEAGAKVVEAFGDSRVAINQSTEDFNCASDLLYPYLLHCQELMAKFRFVRLTWIPRENNLEANKLAQIYSGYAE